MGLRQLRRDALALIALSLALAALCAATESRGQTLTPSQGQTGSGTAAAAQMPIVFSGGHDTDPRDRGRPVILIAAALGVPADVFREAFTHVHPARAGEQPQPDQVRQNKAALMEALGRYGVTDDRLNTVSNYYRYVRSRGEMWPVRQASGYAVVEKGVITKFVVTDGGSGYSSAPTITVPSIPGATAVGQLSFGKTFDHNGSVTTITAAPQNSVR